MCHLEATRRQLHIGVSIMSRPTTPINCRCMMSPVNFQHVQRPSSERICAISWLVQFITIISTSRALICIYFSILYRYTSPWPHQTLRSMILEKSCIYSVVYQFFLCILLSIYFLSTSLQLYCTLSAGPPRLATCEHLIIACSCSRVKGWSCLVLTLTTLQQGSCTDFSLSPFTTDHVAFVLASFCS